MYSKKMDQKLKRLKAMIKKTTNKGGVKLAVEMAEINQALKGLDLDAMALEEVVRQALRRMVK